MPCFIYKELHMQNYKNHIRFNPLHHFILTPLLAVLFIWSVVELITASEITSFSILMVLITFALIFISLIARLYGLKNQDRLIRLEMRQRYFEMTGQSFKGKEEQLRLSQIIALRFASDEELLELMDRAIKEKLTGKDIKKSIKSWQPDYLRV